MRTIIALALFTGIANAQCSNGVCPRPAAVVQQTIITVQQPVQQIVQQPVRYYQPVRRVRLFGKKAR